MGISHKGGCDIFCPETVSALVLQEIQPLNFPWNTDLEPVSKLCESIWSVFLVVTLIFFKSCLESPMYRRLFPHLCSTPPPPRVWILLYITTNSSTLPSENLSADFLWSLWVYSFYDHLSILWVSRWDIHKHEITGDKHLSFWDMDKSGKHYAKWKSWLVEWEFQ